MVWLVCAFAAVAAHAQTPVEQVILGFDNFPQGANPYGTLLRGADANLYGTANQGGAVNAGAVFQLGPDGFKVLYSFRDGADGANPYAGVIQDSAGNLYGTTYQGGPANAGVVYKIDPAGQETVLYTFTGGADGGNPYAGLMADSAGNLYGAAVNGGSANAGAVYKLDASGQFTVLYSFTGQADGAHPYGNVIADAAGNLYGSTSGGGSLQAGVLYKLDTAGVETVLHDFGGRYGSAPTAGVVEDAAGNFYGTATNVVYELTANGQYHVLWRLGCQTGGDAAAGVFLDAAGNLYGTTGAAGPGCFASPAPYGAVYKLDAGGRFSVCYRFPGATEAADLASGPNPGVVLDSAGDIYGTTPYGGVSGMAYKIDTSGQRTVLFTFSGAPGGTHPFGGLIRDTSGNFYGTTGAGGTTNGGVLYKLDAAGQETVLHTFTDGVGLGVVRDAAGNLFGTADSAATGLGLVYELEAAGNYTVLYRFAGGDDGGGAIEVILDPAGNLYGTTFGGGAADAGTVFKLDPAGDYTLLYSFSGGADGGDPNPGLIRDAAGNLYGTTLFGGRGYGVVYKLDTSGQETVLYSFTGGADGGNPIGVILDPSGNLYGTTPNFGAGGGGVVFGLDKSLNYSVLYSFAYGADGFGPYAGVIRDAAGDLYGTTHYGGASGCGGLGCGVVYKLDASGHETVLHSFTGGFDGASPEAGVIMDAAGDLYGSTPWGGKGGDSSVQFAGAGVVYKIVLH